MDFPVDLSQTKRFEGLFCTLASLYELNVPNVHFTYIPQGPRAYSTGLTDEALASLKKDNPALYQKALSPQIPRKPMRPFYDVEVRYYDVEIVSGLIPSQFKETVQRLEVLKTCMLKNGFDFNQISIVTEDSHDPSAIKYDKKSTRILHVTFEARFPYNESRIRKLYSVYRNTMVAKGSDFISKNHENAEAACAFLLPADRDKALVDLQKLLEQAPKARRPDTPAEGSERRQRHRSP